MILPDTEAVEHLLSRGGLTGAEIDVLHEFLSQGVSDWQQEHDREIYEVDDEGNTYEGDPDADDYAEHFPVGALMRRVNSILQNHR